MAKIAALASGRLESPVSTDFPLRLFAILAVSSIFAERRACTALTGFKGDIFKHYSVICEPNSSLWRRSKLLTTRFVLTNHLRYSHVQWTLCNSYLPLPLAIANISLTSRRRRREWSYTRPLCFNLTAIQC